MQDRDLETKRSILWGIGGSLLLLALYFLILILADSFSHALEQFQIFDFWLLALAGGFGIQVGLYAYIRQKIRQNQRLKTAKKEVAATAGVTTTSMIACCAHHLVDVLPIMGLSALFLFLSDYQVLFLLLGVISNIIGIIFMLEIIKKHFLFKEVGILSRIVQFNLKALRNWAFAGSAFVLLIVFLLIRNNHEQDSLVKPNSLVNKPEVSAEETTVFLPPKTNSEGGLSVEVRPQNFSFNESVQFEILLDTHQGNLDFDLTQKAVLSDDQNNQFKPLEWQGERGGHHLSGILIFPVIRKETKRLKLVIKDIYGVKEREFLWGLE